MALRSDREKNADHAGTVAQQSSSGNPKLGLDQRLFLFLLWVRS